MSIGTGPRNRRGASRQALDDSFLLQGVGYKVSRRRQELFLGKRQRHPNFESSPFTVVSLTCTLLVAFAALALASPVADPHAAPAVTPAPAPEIVKRATSCTFSGSNGASSASKSQKSCSTIVLSAIAVPSGTTLDLSDLPDDTTVIFEGETTWGYEEWDGPLLQIEGTGISIQGASGAYLNADSSRWWDGEGSNGDKTKPKFFYAHDLTDSTITNLYIQNTAVQVVNIDNADGLTITYACTAQELDMAPEVE